MIVAGALRWGCAFWLLSTSPGDAPELPRTLPRANHGRYKPYSGNRRKNQRPTIDRIAAGWQAAAPPCALCFLPVSPRLREMRAGAFRGCVLGLVLPWFRLGAGLFGRYCRFVPGYSPFLERSGLAEGGAMEAGAALLSTDFTGSRALRGRGIGRCCGFKLAAGREGLPRSRR